MEFLKKALDFGKASARIMAYPAVSYPVAFVAGKYFGSPVFGLISDLIGKAIK